MLIGCLALALGSCSLFKHTHDFSQEIVGDEYLQKEATCTSAATYYYSCKCGEKGSDTFTSGDKLPHSYTKKITTSKYLHSEATHELPAKYYFACEHCDQRGTHTFEHGTPLLDTWTYGYYRDNQFGEKTDEWYIITENYLDGTFDNSATSDSDLLVDILYDCDDTISIFLYEYAKTNNPVKNNSSRYKDYYKIVVKNEKGTTYEARGQMHPGSDRIYIINTYHNTVLNLMKTSKHLKFYIQNEDFPTTQYRFDVDMNNFNEVLKRMQ